jgi:hypothetical protein
MVAMMLKKMELMGLTPPVALFTLLLPYPPKAGRLMKQAPTRFAAPRATSSRLGLSWMSGNALVPPRLLAATEDSKNPSSAMRKEVPIASRMCFMWEVAKGHRNVNR